MSRASRYSSTAFSYSFLSCAFVPLSTISLARARSFTLTGPARSMISSISRTMASSETGIGQSFGLPSGLSSASSGATAASSPASRTRLRVLMVFLQGLEGSPQGRIVRPLLLQADDRVLQETLDAPSLLISDLHEDVRTNTDLVPGRPRPGI